jgi:hypothetical protein
MSVMKRHEVRRIVATMRRVDLVPDVPREQRAAAAPAVTGEGEPALIASRIRGQVSHCRRLAQTPPFFVL